MAIPWILFVVAVISVGITYVGRRLIRTSHFSKPWNAAAWTGLVLLFVMPISLMALIRRSSELPLALSWIAYVGLGLLSFVFFLLVFRDTLWFLSLVVVKISHFISHKSAEPDPSRRQFLLQSMNLGVVGAAALATSYGIYRARTTPGRINLDIP
jgi:hypothetical protein